MEKLRKYITARSAFSRRELARLISYDPGSFNQWLQGSRHLPDDKAEKLATVLKKYGFKK